MVYRAGDLDATEFIMACLKAFR
jgi:hypothetical protein